MKFLVKALVTVYWFLLFGGISQAQSLTSPHGGAATSQPSRTNLSLCCFDRFSRRAVMEQRSGT